MILALSIHYSRASDLVRPDHLVTTPRCRSPPTATCSATGAAALVAPAGRFVLSTDALVNDSGLPDVVAPGATQTPVEQLPEETLVFLLGSRYCETDLLSEIAWQLFGAGPTGWARVQAICDFVHHHIEFGYEHARRTRTAWEAYNEGQRRLPRLRAPGHRALPLHEHPGALLHRLPRRHRHRPPYGPMDFAGWFEAYLGDRWYTFDARNNTPRIGRVLIARGRDACDVALTSTFGPNTLERFKVWTDEVAASLNGARAAR